MAYPSGVGLQKVLGRAGWRVLTESDARGQKGTWRQLQCGRGTDCQLPPPSDCPLDSTASQLTPQEPQLCLVDAGYFLNTSCPSMFRPGRRLDLILSFDYSLPSSFEVPLVAPWEPQTPCGQAMLQGQATGPLTLTSWAPKGREG